MLDSASLLTSMRWDELGSAVSWHLVHSDQSELSGFCFCSILWGEFQQVGLRFNQSSGLIRLCWVVFSPLPPSHINYLSIVFSTPALLMCSQAHLYATRLAPTGILWQSLLCSPVSWTTVAVRSPEDGSNLSSSQPVEIQSVLFKH